MVVTHKNVNYKKVNKKKNSVLLKNNHLHNKDIVKKATEKIKDDIESIKKVTPTLAVVTSNEEEKPKIHKTTNYDLFKFLNANRMLMPKKIAKLAEDMKIDNFLSSIPIIVNPNMEILDGQHRFEAAKMIGATIYYIISTNIKISDISKINSTSQNWKLDDYLNFFIAQGKDDYKKLFEFCEKYNLSVYNAVGLLSGRTTQPNSELIHAFKEGKFKAKDVSHAIKVINMIDDFKLYAEDFYKSKTFLNAVSKIAKIDKYSHINMLKKLGFLSRKLVKNVDVTGYVETLGEIYNFKTRKNEKIDFVKVIEQ